MYIVQCSLREEAALWHRNFAFIRFLKEYSCTEDEELGARPLHLAACITKVTGVTLLVSCLGLPDAHPGITYCLWCSGRMKHRKSTTYLVMCEEKQL